MVLGDEYGEESADTIGIAVGKADASAGHDSANRGSPTARAQHVHFKGLRPAEDASAIAGQPRKGTADAMTTGTGTSWDLDIAGIDAAPSSASVLPEVAAAALAPVVMPERASARKPTVSTAAVLVPKPPPATMVPLVLVPTASPAPTASVPAEPSSESTASSEPLPAAAVSPTPIPAQPVSCGRVDSNVDYPGNDLAVVPNVPVAEDCCQACAVYVNCLAWTWASDSHTCFLKGGHPRGALTKVHNPSLVSGMPTQVNRSIPVIERSKGQSLFCFCLMMPSSYEQQLIALQYRNGAGIFGCDEYSVYSNLSLEVAPQVRTLIVRSNLTCHKGGEFQTALNTDIFMAVWEKVMTDGRYLLHDWTAKVDPDSVFFPVRLRGILLRYIEDVHGVYLNNCHRGMHGPLEVFSRVAVQRWASGRERCIAHFTKLCSGPCKWGEDMFIDQCLWKVLQVQRINDWNLLVEDHCDPPPGWQSCHRASVAAFHPFKTVDGYARCLSGAIAA